MLGKVPLKGRWITDRKYHEQTIRMAFLSNDKVVDIASHEAGQAG